MYDSFIIALKLKWIFADITITVKIGPIIDILK